MADHLETNTPRREDAMDEVAPDWDSVHARADAAIRDGRVTSARDLLDQIDARLANRTAARSSSSGIFDGVEPPSPVVARVRGRARGR